MRCGGKLHDGAVRGAIAMSVMRAGPGDPATILASIPFQDRTLPALLEARCSDSPDRPIVDIAGEVLTWADLDQRSARLAGGLATLGISPGDVVCQMAGNTAAHVVAAFAVARLGAIECPVNTGLRGEPLRHVLSHSGARALLVEASHTERVLPELNQIPAIPFVIIRDGPASDVAGSVVMLEEELEGGRLPDHPIAPWEPATIMYTSGTTGPAKGVVLPHHFAFSTAAVKVGIWGLGPKDVLFSPLPLFHANARYSTLLTACILNARAVIVSRFSASQFWDQVRDAGATEVGTVGTVAPILLERPADERDRDHSVRMMHGAGALPLERREEFERRFGVHLVTGFAMTETSHFSTTSPDDPGRYLGAGRPVPTFRVAILDDEDRAVVRGEVGEIAVRPETPFSIFLHYHRQPEATLEAFRNLWFHTGDLGYLDDDGYLHWVDRRKDAIRRKGEMISSRDVEAAALSFPGVAEAAAIGVPGDLGEEEVKLFVRSEESATIRVEELLEHCRSTLPDFAVPRYYEVVEAFPEGSTHKIDKKALRAAGVGEGTWDATAHHVPPRRGGSSP
jgi:crotonobetaine/carnitine-CoA ligase